MIANAPQFAELNAIEEQLLVAKLQAIRSAIHHAGEKGRALEYGVHTFLRSILPAEYGISTGFIVYHTDNGPRLSSQLDIIIYDAIRNGPIVSLETCNVFPLEAVYAYVEVKASLQSSSNEAKEPAGNSIEKCLKDNHKLREMRDRRYWVPQPNSSVNSILITHQWMPIRSYVFAFESQGTVAGDLAQLAQRMANTSRKYGSHMHGVFIANQGFLYTRPVDVQIAKQDDSSHIYYTNNHSLSAFKSFFLQGLTTFPRTQQEWAPAIDQYFQLEPNWDFKRPIS